MSEHGFSLIEAMVAAVVLGVTVAGTYEGLQWIATHTHTVNLASESDAAMAAAIEDLLRLDDRSPMLSDDGDTNDLNNLANPDHQTDASGLPWRIRVGTHTFGVVYNVARGLVYPNTVLIRIHVFWNGGDPFATAPDPRRTVSRTIVREVAPL